VVGVAFVVGAALVAFAAFGTSWESFVNNAPDIIMLGGVLMAEFAALLLPLRRLAGWRLDFDAAYHRPAARRGQIGLMDFAAMFCAVALPLTLGRVLMDAKQEEGAGILAFMGLFGLIVAATAAPVAWMALTARRLPWIAAACAWVLAMSWGQSLLAERVPDLDLFSSQPVLAGLHWEMLALHGGIATAVAMPLLVLRTCGLKLLVVEGRAIKA
jgi:hypothetical protein